MRWFVGWRMHLVHALLAFSVGVGVGTYATNTWHRAKAADALEEQLKEAERQADAEHKSDEATQAVGEATATRTNEIRYQTRTLIREVPVYVTAQDDGRCIVNRGFVRLHDQAATGTPSIPDSAGEPDSAPSGVALSTVGATVADNYGTCREYRAIAEGWQTWYAEQAKLWSQK